MGIRFVEKAIEFEMRRHAEALTLGDHIETETRRYDAEKNKTISMRSKEENIDYRFLVDPDLPIFRINPQRIEKIRKDLSPVPFI
jgi:aspartyl-tRNA(Asn)/glutamyl-tRNA(Gln) amidotransferase subunit B